MFKVSKIASELTDYLTNTVRLGLSLQDLWESLTHRTVNYNLDSKSWK